MPAMIFVTLCVTFFKWWISHFGMKFFTCLQGQSICVGMTGMSCYILYCTWFSYGKTRAEYFTGNKGVNLHTGPKYNTDAGGEEVHKKSSVAWSLDYFNKSTFTQKQPRQQQKPTGVEWGKQNHFDQTKTLLGSKVIHWSFRIWCIYGNNILPVDDAISKWKPYKQGLVLWFNLPYICL